MPRSLLLTLLLLAALPLAAQDARQVYAKSADSVVYLRHEILVDGTKAGHPALWKQLEAFYKIKVLGTTLPVASGSGFFVDTDGRLLTNRHVAAAGDAKKVRALAAELLTSSINDLPDFRFGKSDKEALRGDLKALLGTSTYQFLASVAGKDLGPVEVLALAPENDPDLALVQVKGLTSVPLVLAPEGSGGTDLVGADVLSLGYPLGSTLDSLFKERVVTMNRGGVSAYRGTELLDLQHSAAISHGNSGGPLMTLDGLVVGVNTAELDTAGGKSLFYSVSAKKVRAFLTSQGFTGLLRWFDRPAAQATVQTRFTSEPTGAEVRADGRLLGQTPLEMRLVPGAYRVELRLAGFGFAPADLTVATGPVDYRGTGQALVPVKVVLPARSQAGAVVFTGGGATYRFADLAAAAVPEGSYQATLENALGFEGVSLDLRIAGSSATADFTAHQRTANLTIRGWVPGAQVWVDGTAWEGASGPAFQVPVGVHTVKASKTGSTALLPTEITVRADGKSFLTWKPEMGYSDRQRLARTGVWVTGVGGAVLTVVGLLAGDNDLAIKSTHDYQGYRSWKTNADFSVLWGIVSMLSAVAFEGYAQSVDAAVKNEQREFNQ